MGQNCAKRLPVHTPVHGWFIGTSPAGQCVQWAEAWIGAFADVTVAVQRDSPLGTVRNWDVKMVCEALANALTARVGDRGGAGYNTGIGVGGLDLAGCNQGDAKIFEVLFWSYGIKSPRLAGIQ